MAAWSPDEDTGSRPREGSQWAEVRRIVEQADPRPDRDRRLRRPSPWPTGCRTPSTGCWPRRSGPTRERLRAGRGPGGRLAGDPPARGDRGAARAQPAGARRRSPRPSPPPSVDVGTTTALDVAWWIRQRLDRPRRRALVPARASPCSGPGCRWSPTAARWCPASRYDAVIEPGDLVHCDVGLSSLGLRTDTQRNGYVLRPGETEAPAGLRAALATANRMQDLTLRRPRARPHRQRGAGRGPRGSGRRGHRRRRLLAPRGLPRARRRPGHRPVGPAGRDARAGRPPGARRTPSMRSSSPSAGRCRSGTGSWCGWPSRTASRSPATASATWPSRQTELILIG